MKKHYFTYIDLFSGIGGFRIGLDKLGGKSVGYSEIDKQALETYKLNFKDPEEHDLGDVILVNDVPHVDMMVGGVPCQSWSVAGKMRGFEDPRGRLWFDTIRMVKQSRPKVFIFENVKGLADPRNRENLDLIVSSFNDLGYHVDYKLLNAYDFGQPQNRSRIFIVGFQKKYKSFFEKFEFPKPINLDKKLSYFIEGVKHKDIVKKKYDPEHLFGGRVPASRNSFQKHDEFNDFFVFCDTRNGHTTIHSWDIRNTTKVQKEICMTILKNRRKKVFGLWDGNPIPYKALRKLYPKTTKKDVDSLVKMKILKYNENGDIDLVHSKNSAGIDNIYRVYLPNSEIFSTLTATGTKDYIALDYVYGNTVKEYKDNFIKKIYKKNKLRQITPREASNIQGFPVEFILHPSDKYAHKQVGNSVSPPVVEYLGKEILKTGLFG